jgi:hypothetical protein
VGDLDRERCWREFCDAADQSAYGDHEAATALVAHSPIVREELRAFVKALRCGKIRKIGPYRYENVGKG